MAAPSKASGDHEVVVEVASATSSEGRPWKRARREEVTSPLSVSSEEGPPTRGQVTSPLSISSEEGPPTQPLPPPVAAAQPLFAADQPPVQPAVEPQQMSVEPVELAAIDSPTPAGVPVALSPDVPPSPPFLPPSASRRRLFATPPPSPDSRKIQPSQ